jgi:hypothetical protein
MCAASPSVRQCFKRIHRADHATPLYQQKLAITSLTSCGRSVGIVRSRTETTKLSFSLILIVLCLKSRNKFTYILQDRTEAPALCYAWEIPPDDFLCLETSCASHFDVKVISLLPWNSLRSSGDKIEGKTISIESHEVCYWALHFMPLVILHHLLNVFVQLANKRGFTKNLWKSVS